MSEDPLDKDTSIDAEITPTGLSVKARSRAVAAFDRLLGNVIDRVNLPFERKNARERAEMAAELQLIEAVAKALVHRVETDPELLDRAMRNLLRTQLSRQANKDGVVRHAIEDLRRESKSDEAASFELDPDFINRLERFAENATTEQLREKWGRVLGAEIRTPGTFPPKVLRIIDELEADTALLFEQLCRSRIQNALPICIVTDLPRSQTARLAEAGLIFEPGLDVVRFFTQGVETRESGNEEIWFMAVGEGGVGFNNETAAALGGGHLIGFGGSGGKLPGLPALILTDAGHSISTILPANYDETLRDIIALMRKAAGHDKIFEFRRRGDGSYERVTSGTKIANSGAT
jgi:hypothetical protein